MELISSLLDNISSFSKLSRYSSYSINHNIAFSIKLEIERLSHSANCLNLWYLFSCNLNVIVFSHRKRIGKNTTEQKIMLSKFIVLRSITINWTDLPTVLLSNRCRDRNWPDYRICQRYPTHWNKIHPKINRRDLRALKDFISERNCPIGWVVHNGERVEWLDEKILGIPATYLWSTPIRRKVK